MNECVRVIMFVSLSRFWHDIHGQRDLKADSESTPDVPETWQTHSISDVNREDAARDLDQDPTISTPKDITAIPNQ